MNENYWKMCRNLMVNELHLSGKEAGRYLARNFLLEERSGEEVFGLINAAISELKQGD